ncbi:MAG: translational GTPase TypA [Candidatus Marinamargulisbacteria bacterium]
MTKNIRNVAIIAHVDHGKTTLVDQLFKQSGLFRDNQHVEERIMDSMDLERERGITIQAKNGAFQYQDTHINIIDTPGHADFGGEVERVLKMADGALFLVDAQEGPMPQSYFVLKKAIAQQIPLIVVINKIDKPSSRPDWVLDQVFDLMVKLNASDDMLDFPVIYASAKNGWASMSLDVETDSMKEMYDLIVSALPEPAFSSDDPLQLLVSTISYSPFLGRSAIGKITGGVLKVNQSIGISTGLDSDIRSGRISKLHVFKGNDFDEVSSASAGQIVALSGIQDVTVGETIVDPDHPAPLPMAAIDPPTISVAFLPNDSPFAGKEGEFVTTRQLRERLFRETLSDVALKVSDSDTGIGYQVAGRGELHISILIEKMRREGYEFQVSRPKVIFKTIDGVKQEPYENVTITVDESLGGKVIESMAERKGQMTNMIQDGASIQYEFKTPTRGLLGYQSLFMKLTKGLGTLYSTFENYQKFSGEIRSRQRGVLISKETCQTVAYALSNLQERAELFLGPGISVYKGQIVGLNAREDDMVVNVAKSKKLTNMRAAGSDDNVLLTPPTVMSLEDCLSFINDDELIEITPKTIRLRKR